MKRVRLMGCSWSLSSRRNRHTKHISLPVPADMEFAALMRAPRYKRGRALPRRATGGFVETAVMAEIVFGFGTSHGPLLATPPQEWDLRANVDRKNKALAFGAGTMVSEGLTAQARGG